MILVVIALAAITSALFWFLAKRFEKSIKEREIPNTKHNPLISILIPTYKSEAKIAKTLEAIKNSDYPKKEVIVINDSDDRTPEIVGGYGAAVIQNKERRGKGHALNMGANKAKGELLLFLDSDAELEPDTLSKMVSSFYHHQSQDKKTAMIVPNYTGSNKNIAIAKVSDLEQCAHQTWIRAQMNLGSILSIRGSCMLMPKNLFDEIGGFAPIILEDGDFAARLRGAGYNIKYEPRANVRIAEPESVREFFRAKKRYGKGTFFCALRHKGTYLASKHAAISFYPGLAIIAAIIAFLVTTPILNLIAAILILLPIPALALLNIKLSENRENLKKSDFYMKMLSMSLMPLVILTYLYGVVSGIWDRLSGKPELKFQDW